MITKIEALYFKGFNYIQLLLKEYNVLVGPNASGKSSFLDILTFFKDVLDKGPAAAVEKRCADFRELVWNKESNYFELALEIKLPDAIPSDYSLSRYELRIAFEESQGIIIENEALWFIKDIQYTTSQKKHNGQLHLFPTDRQPPSHIITEPRKRTPVGWRKIVSKSKQGNDYFRSEKSEWNITYRFGPRKASLARIPEDENKFPLAIWIKNLLMEGIQYIQLNSNTMKRPCRPDASVYFEPDGSNLPKVIVHLKENSPDAFNRWQNHVKTALPDIEEIGVQERSEDRFLYIFIKYKNVIVPSWLLSDGTLRLLALTIIPYLPDKGKVYIIEEPENGLHPLAIESVIQSLSSVYDGQVFLATHSPIILQLSEPKDILCFAKTESGNIDVIRGEEHPVLKDWKKEADLATLYASGVLQ